VSAAVKPWLARLLAGVLVLAGLYLVGVNAALNLPATRDVLNRLQPDAFAVSWKRAYSPWPLRLVFMGVESDGATPTTQWQVDASRVAASVSLPALFRGEVLLKHLALKDMDLRLRPLAGPDADLSRVARYFPVIRHRDPNALAGPAPAPQPGTLVLELDDIRLSGEHEVWVGQVRGGLNGEVSGNFRMDTATGELSLAEGKVDLMLTALAVGPEKPVAGDAMIRGRVDIPPFAPAETHGLALMRVGDVDARVDLPVQSLAFVRWLMPAAAALDLTGRGRLRGRLALAAGEVLAGTDLTVEAHELAMGLGAYRFSGDGFVDLRVDPNDASQADLTVRFDQVQAAFASKGAAATAPEVLFTGRGLTARMHAAEVDPTTTSTAEHTDDLLDELDLGFTLTIPSVRVDDIAVYNRLFPAKWDMELLGGKGSLSGRFAVTRDNLDLDLDLTSDDAELRLAGYHAGADLLLKLRAAVTSRGAGHDTAMLDMTGTEVRLDDAQLAAAAQDSGAVPSWSARFVVDAADLGIALSPQQARAGAVRAVATTLSEEGFGAVLSAADGSATAALTVAELDWIAVLLGRPLGLGLYGQGELDLDLVLVDGWPAPGSALRFPRDPLSATLLDYRIDGTGEASLELEPGGGGPHPRARLALALADARLRRRDEDQASVDEVRMDAQLRVRDPFAESVEDAAAGAELALKIHSASVPDMRTYNPYLPGHGPVAFTGGAASLVGDLAMTADRASGQLLLTAEGVGVAVPGAELSGDLRLELLIRDGSAEDLRFDITGSSLVLTGFGVTGRTASTTDADWHARLQMEETEMLWQKPMHLDLKADITVKDTRPFVALVDDLREEHSWLEDMLVMEDLGGHLILRVDGDEAVIEDAMLSGAQMGVHARGRAGADGREAMLLLRWQDLSGALELHGEQRRFEILDARARFDAYAPGRAPLPAMPAQVHSQKHAEGGVADTAAMTPARAPAPGTAPAGPPHEAAGGLRATPPTHKTQPAAPDNPFLDHSL
jgi:hypothetical protein